MSGDVEALAEVLRQHQDQTVDLGTPRQYTGHGGWNVSCQCGHLFGSDDEATERWPLHVAEILAARDAAIRADAVREAADELWRVFLRLPRTPSPLGDYIQRRVLLLRARADREAAASPTRGNGAGTGDAS